MLRELRVRRRDIGTNGGRSQSCTHWPLRFSRATVSSNVRFRLAINVR
jgi:hypothetical protein